MQWKGYVITSDLLFDSCVKTDSGGFVTNCYAGYRRFDVGLKTSVEIGNKPSGFHAGDVKRFRPRSATPCI